MEIIKNLSTKNNTTVQLVKINGIEYVAKFYKKFSRQMFIELNIMATCQHQNIMSINKLLPMCDQYSIGMIMTKESNNYLDYVRQNKLSILDKIDLLLQIAHGLQYLHANNIVHMDLKSDNIMITNRICKIIDFGSAEYLFNDKVVAYFSQCTSTHCPPEAFGTPKTLFEFNTSFDIWSFGMVVYETFTEKPIYQNEIFPVYHNPTFDPKIEQAYNLKLYQFIMSVGFGKTICDFVPDFLHDCLNFNPNFRPKISTIISRLLEYQTELLTKDNIKTTYQYDNNLFLKNSVIVPNNLQLIPLTYCDYLLNGITQFFHKNHKKYPNKIIDCTFAMVSRLTVMYQMLPVEYVNQAVIIGYLFAHENNIPNAVPFINFSKHGQPKLLNEIIMALGGAVFQEI